MAQANPLTRRAGITKGQNAANYIFWLSELQPTVRETDENRDKDPKSGGPIELDSVRFSYPLRPDAVVLRGVDMEVRLRAGPPPSTRPCLILLNR